MGAFAPFINRNVYMVKNLAITDYLENSGWAQPRGLKLQLVSCKKKGTFSDRSGEIRRGESPGICQSANPPRGLFGATGSAT
jgi:hypothetical protein